MGDLQSDYEYNNMVELHKRQQLEAEGKVRAKFKVHSVVQNIGYSAANPVNYTVKLIPVCDGSEENKRFYAMTPGGDITLTTISEKAGSIFRAGQEYYIDFTPAS